MFISIDRICLIHGPPAFHQIALPDDRRQMVKPHPIHSFMQTDIIEFLLMSRSINKLGNVNRSGGPLPGGRPALETLDPAFKLAEFKCICAFHNIIALRPGRTSFY